MNFHKFNLQHATPTKYYYNLLNARLALNFFLRKQQRKKKNLLKRNIFQSKKQQQKLLHSNDEKFGKTSTEYRPTYIFFLWNIGYMLAKQADLTKERSTELYNVQDTRNNIKKVERRRERKKIVEYFLIFLLCCCCLCIQKI